MLNSAGLRSLTRIRSTFAERIFHSEMWSRFKKIFHRFIGGGKKQDHSSLLPKGIDKLRTEFSSTAELDEPGGPITAREGFELALEIIQDFDSLVRLNTMESVGALNSQGQAEGWIFVFLLPSRWGHARFRFCNIAGKESLTIKLIPFAPAGSALDKMLLEGQGGFVEQQWKVELERQPALSRDFLDSQEALSIWQSQGKYIDYNSPLVLRAVTPPLGKARWELLEAPGSKKSLYTLGIE